MANEKRPSLTELRKRAKATQDDADELESTAANAKDEARELAKTAAAAYAELDREEWARAQESLGVAREHLDLERMMVTSLPPGPTHDVLTNGTVSDG